MTTGCRTELAEAMQQCARDVQAEVSRREVAIASMIPYLLG